MRYFAILALLCSACAGSLTFTKVKYAVIEKTVLAETRTSQQAGLLTCKAPEGVYSQEALIQSCLRECYRRITLLDRQDKTDDLRDGKKVMTVGKTKRICKHVE